MSCSAQAFEELSERDVNQRFERGLSRAFESLEQQLLEKGGFDATEWSPAVDFAGQMETHYMRDAPRAVLEAEFGVCETRRSDADIAADELENGRPDVDRLAAAERRVAERELAETVADTKATLFSVFSRVCAAPVGGRASAVDLIGDRAVHLVGEYLFGEDSSQWIADQLSAVSLQTTVPSLHATHKRMAASRRAGLDEPLDSDSDSGFTSDSESELDSD